MKPKMHLYIAFQNDVLKIPVRAINISTNNPFVSKEDQANSQQSSSVINLQRQN